MKRIKMRRAASTAPWLAVACLFVAGPLAGQEAPREYPWSATLHYDAQRVTRGAGDGYWHTLTAGVGRLLPGGSVAVQGVATRRFDIHDRALVADVYHGLWRGAYGNVRMAVAPGAQMLSRFDAGGELFQTVGNNELAASLRHQRFEVTEVNTFGVAVAHYVGNWYLRPRSIVARVDGSWSPFVAFSARRYIGDGTDNTVDLAAGFGEEVLEVAAPATGPGPLEVITSGSRFAAVRGQRYLSGNLGITASVSYSDYAEIDNRWGVSVGLLTRW